jgi:predicted PurR-regulated permease PerM
MERVDWQRLRDILISIICVGILLWAAWSILSQFLHAVVLLLLSMALAFLLTPAVNMLTRQKYMPRVVATLIVYLVVLAVVSGIGYALVFSLIKQVESFSYVVKTYFTSLPDKYTQFQAFLVSQGIPQSNINAAIAQIQGQVTGFAQSMATNALNIVLAVTNALVDVLLVLVLGFYLTLDGQHIRDSLFNLIPKRSQSFFLLSEDALNRVVGNYIRGQLTLALIIGILAGMGCAFLGLKDYAIIIGVLAFLFETIPMVGPALASIPAILISLLLPEPFPRTFYIVIYFVIVQMLESNIFGPRIVGHAVGLHPVASIFALIVGAQLFGAFGALLATPIVAAAWVVIASLYRSARGETADEMLARRRVTRTLPRMFTRGLESDGTHPGGNGDLEPEATAAHVKPTHISGKMDQIDLMRPVSPGHEQQPGAHTPHTHNHKRDSKELTGETNKEET